MTHIDQHSNQNSNKPPIRAKIIDLIEEYGIDTLAELVASLEPTEKLSFEHCFDLWARPNQHPHYLFQHEDPSKPDYNKVLLLAGRGFGKTRTVMEAVKFASEQYAFKKLHIKAPLRIALVGRTIQDIVDVCLDGESGFRNIIHPSWTISFNAKSNRLILIDTVNNRNVCMISTHTDREPNKIRGNEYHLGVIDELASFDNASEVLMNLDMSLRLGEGKLLIATTPKPTQVIQSLVEDPYVKKIYGATFENFGCLPEKYLEDKLREYGGTKIGRQELFGQLINANEGALFDDKIIKKSTIKPNEAPTTFEEIIISVDPTTTATRRSDTCGIVVLGKHLKKVYVLEDGSIKAAPTTWAKQVVKLYHKHNASRVLAETNQGGNLVRDIILQEDNTLNIKTISNNQSKIGRFERLSTIMERGDLLLVGTHKELVNEMITIDSSKSKYQKNDRVDALTTGTLNLLENRTPQVFSIRF